jgi:hypothetical protein
VGSRAPVTARPSPSGGVSLKHRLGQQLRINCRCTGLAPSCGDLRGFASQASPPERRRPCAWRPCIRRQMYTPVWSKTYALRVFQQPAEPFTTSNRAFTLAPLTGHRKAQVLLFP